MEHTQNDGSCTLKGQIMPTTTTRKISDFVDPGDTPGNVAICISGGGSISMMSTLGQLRALKQMGVLDKARTISTVSGGSWATVLFTFLPDGIKDDDFLGTYVDDPTSLRLKSSETNNPAAALDFMSDDYMGKVVADDGMLWESLAYEAKCLSQSGFPTYRIWNYLIARHILEPFGLAKTDKNAFNILNKTDCNGDKTERFITPSWFAYNETLQGDILTNNQDLKGIASYIYCVGGADNVKRPYHLCNTSMLVNPGLSGTATDGSDSTMLASVQSTAIGTGIFSSNVGLPFPSDGGPLQKAGGGLVSSYAFNSSNVQKSGNEVTVNVQKDDLFSLTDITANSSAFYATAVPELSGLDPTYNYWSPAQDNPESNFTKFADGGAIEDNGLLNALAYDDIEKAVVFVNALRAVSLDGATVASDHMNVIVDTWIPTYFGYTPYQDEKKAKENGLKQGYTKYSDLDASHYDYTGKGIRFFKHNQIFDSSLFPAFLETIWNNLNNNNGEFGSKKGLYQGPSVYHNPSIYVNPNPWFGIKGGKNIELLLVHYGPYKGFTDKLYFTVADRMDIEVVANRDKYYPDRWEKDPALNMFPNFAILETHMPTEILNLFAHFTSHVAMTQAAKIQAMFQ